MNVDHCLILCAGLGTRMGEIGKRLPKVVWPVFEKNLLELQIDYAQSLGCKNIYVNIHHQYQVVKNSLSESYKSKIKFLHEADLLGSGGAIHNLAAQDEIDYKGNLLTLNGDQFLFLNKKHIETGLEKLKECTNVLFGLKVLHNSGYNETKLSESSLVEISKPNHSEDYFTFSGTGLTDLSKLKLLEGVSNFFESVADFKNSRVDMLCYEDIEYWDFGTLKRYQESMFRIIDTVENKKQSDFIDFLVENNALDLKKISSQGYNCLNGKNIDLSGENSISGNEVIALTKVEGNISGNSILAYEELIQEI